MLRRGGRWDEALKDLDQAAELDPRGWGVAREQGVTCLYLRRYDEAERHLRKAIALAPDEQEMYGFLAETYWGWTGDLAKARAALQAMPPSGDGGRRTGGFGRRSTRATIRRRSTARWQAQSTRSGPL